MSEYVNKPQGYFGTPRREMLEFVPEGVKSVLEIGCGTGAFGALVKQQRGCRYTGVELMEKAASQARSQLDEVIVANIEHSSLPFPLASFDCLVCNDVLEHLVDPWLSLRALTKYLQPGGYVVASLPNVRFSEVVKDLVFRKRWEYKEQGVLDRTHLRFFTESSMRALFESTGLEILQLKGINAIKYAWRLRLLNYFLFGALNDMRYMQYGCLCRLPTDGSR
jgi:2-polyprenyl-3-methyl-5-hydroxy-6-metoxy-1,4-benzoquinol methylase